MMEFNDLKKAFEVFFIDQFPLIEKMKDRMAKNEKIDWML